MNRETRKKLNELNRRFYTLRSKEFSASRDHPWPGWEKLLCLLEIEKYAAPLRVLDVGCGNGRFLRFLMNSGVGSVHYIGLDQSPELLELAKLGTRVREGDRIEWTEGNLLEENSRLSLPSDSFDLIAVFGLLHHLPGREERRALLEALQERLRAGGVLALTAWRFRDSTRFDRHVVSWEEYNLSATEKIDLAELEAGDHLLSFGDKTLPPRYCHDCDMAEISALERHPGLECLSSFESDGRGGNLNRYMLLRRIE